jgi:ribosomal protein S18 acetylase RimI-like enzyme
MEIATKNPSVVDVFLHVQINNDDAIAFYKQNGFVVTETIENYYKKIQPAACYLLSKPVTRH